jgi:hypothetical protein
MVHQNVDITYLATALFQAIAPINNITSIIVIGFIVPALQQRACGSTGHEEVYNL